MTKKTKIALIFSHLIILVIGVAGGFYLSAETLKEGIMMTSQGAMISRYALKVDLIRNEGDRDAYRKALIAYIGVLDDIINHPTKMFDAKTTSVDKMLIYERLSRLEREAGNENAANDYMKLSVQICGNTGWQNCSVEKITKASKLFEENGLISPQAPKVVDVNSKR